MTDQNATPRPSTIRKKRVRILVVDDYADSAEMVAVLLETRGHTTCVAHTAAQALELAASFEPDVAILDLSLTDGTGYELTESFRSSEKLRFCRFVALTGYTDESARRRSEAAGFHRHLTKPFDLDALLEAVAGEDERPSCAPPKGWMKQS